MNHKLKIAALLPLCATLLACGGGGTHAGASTSSLTPAPAFKPSGSQRLADGIWFGTNADGKPAFALLHGQNNDAETEFYFADGVGEDNYLGTYSGFLKLNDGDIGGASVVAPLHFVHAVMSGHADAANTLSATFDLADRYVAGAPYGSYAMTYSADNNRPASLAEVRGNYSPTARTLPGYQGYDTATTPRLSIDAQGKVIGKLLGCNLDGYIRVLDPSKNIYRFSVTAKSDTPGMGCVQGDASESLDLNGFAALVTLPHDKVRSLIFAASGGSNLRMLAGAVPKQ
ncbi:hypothetical protein [Pseudoduganella sp. R-34]|uniref:hypothetical protein n=1 Tax=unclassified Pseudoduganella TaxID=2637179 RepID=UPI003CF244D4